MPVSCFAGIGALKVTLTHFSGLENTFAGFTLTGLTGAQNMSASGSVATITMAPRLGDKRSPGREWDATMIGVWGFSWRRTKEPPAEPVPERGVCAFWHREEGWGAVTTPGHAGLGFVHFSMIRDMTGYRDLIPGSEVDLVHGGPYPHDGCDWRVE